MFWLFYQFVESIHLSTNHQIVDKDELVVFVGHQSTILICLLYRAYDKALEEDELIFVTPRMCHYSRTFPITAPTAFANFSQSSPG